MIRTFLQNRLKLKKVSEKDKSSAEVQDILSEFDADFYRSQYPNIQGNSYDLAYHYLVSGWKLGYNPSSNFSTNLYIKSNQDVQESNINPFLHYIRYGRNEGRHPYALDHEEKVDTNLDRLERHPNASSLEKFFDANFYCAGFPNGQAPLDPISHYLEKGWKEGRDPTPWFSSLHYASLNEDVLQSGMNPFLHYCLSGHTEHREMIQLGRNVSQKLYQSHEASVNNGPYFEEFDPRLGVGRSRRAKVLAYYLPQFHATEVNDRNWGKGFTEWRNLPKALPRFSGHIQPKIPRDLGNYDLSDGDAILRQVQMARDAGLYGFCFYYYSFDGTRALDQPLEQFLSNEQIEFPFCLMWANENWTRTWDGADAEIILNQTYNSKYDNTIIGDIARHMKDSRYINIDGRPLFFIYRPGQIPDAKERISRWRLMFERDHDLSPLFFMAQGFGDTDPSTYNLDGAIEFPPHKLTRGLDPINYKLDFFDRDYKGHVLSYDDVIQKSISEDSPSYPLIKTAIPNWDNEARRPGRGMVIHGSTPEKFESWINQLCDSANINKVLGEPFICVNAWNEWAEGAVLEPDVYYGAAYLNALSRAVHGVPQRKNFGQRKILIVGHDANLNGAQLLALNIGRSLRECFGFKVSYVMGDGGPLISEYERVGDVFISSSNPKDTHKKLSDLRNNGFDIAITNTTASGAAVADLKDLGYTVLSLIHELPNLLKSYDLYAEAESISKKSDCVVFPATFVREEFEAFVGLDICQSEILPQGLYSTAVLRQARGDNGLRSELGLSAETKIVLGVGYADLRKGIDRFISTGLSLAAEHPNIAFIWVGEPASEVINWFQPEIEASGLADRVRILGHREDVANLLAAANSFYLSSREDPFPSVVLEALACGLPVVGHKGCGGCDQLIKRHGTLVAQNDPLAVASALLKSVGERNIRAANARRREIVRSYDFDGYVFNLVKHLDRDISSVSVIVPNYNYESYIGERLHSIFDQTYPLREVIVLDDASSDNSVLEIERTAQAAGRKINLHVNAKNAGSPFLQWRKGLNLAKGDYIWIAEADDLADVTFVERLVDRMQRGGSAIGFTDSRQIDQTGALLGDSYRPYMNEIQPNAFDRAFDMDGRDFIASFLAVKNVILNVSGVIIQRQALIDAFNAVNDELEQFSVAGDWRLYAEICTKPGMRVSWLPESLNTHRRHAVSVTHALKVDKHLAEIASMHSLIGTRVQLSSQIRRAQEKNLSIASSYLGVPAWLEDT